MNDRENKPIILKAILWVIPSFAIFYLAHALLFLLIHLLAGYIIYNLPFSISASSITLFATVVSISVAYFVTTFIQGKIIKHTPINTLSKIILGVILAAYHTPLLVSNLCNGGYYPINIFCIIAALGFMFLNKK